VAAVADLDDAQADRLERDLAAFFAVEDTGPAGGPPCIEYEYLLVSARKPVTPARARPPVAAR
jgi:hypothetical protein